MTISLAERVRSYRREHPQATPSDIALALSANGPTIRTHQVYKVLYDERRKAEEKRRSQKRSFEAPPSTNTGELPTIEQLKASASVLKQARTLLQMCLGDFDLASQYLLLADQLR